MPTPCVKPQENGARCGVEEMTISGAAGRVDVTSAVPLSATVTLHSIADLEQAGHWWELPDSKLTHVILGTAHRCLCTAMLGPDSRPSHRFTGHTYSRLWRLSLLGVVDTIT